jgi:hypothetical protein
MKNVFGPLTLLSAALLLSSTPKAAKGDVIDDQLALQQPVTLQWDAVPWSVDDSVDSKVIGYVLEYNREGSTNWNRNGLYKTPDAPLPVLSPGAWNFRVVGVLSNGLETAASNTIYVWLA